MQGARFAVRADASIIIHAIGQVGALLHLGDQQPRAEGMHRTRRNQKAFSRPDRNPVQQFRQRIRRNRCFHLLQRGFALKAVINARAFVRLKHIPHLGLAQPVFNPPRVVIIRVHLNGERPGRIDQLDQQRKFPGVFRLCAHVLRVLFQILRKRPPGPFARHDRRRPRLVAAQLPAFRQRRAIRLLSPVAPEPHAAPNGLPKRRRKQHRALFFALHLHDPSSSRSFWNFIIEAACFKVNPCSPVSKKRLFCRF